MPNLLARQPIYDEALRVRGYELLFRPGGNVPGAQFDGDQATSSVVVNAFIDRTAQQVVGEVPAFINMTAGLLQNGMVELLPADKVVLEILETILIDDALLDTVRRLARRGYRFALDDFEWRPDLAPLLDIVDYVKIDVLALDRARVEQQLDRVRHHRASLLAEKVETHEVLEQCRTLGFTHFQGYFLSKPHIVPGRTIEANQLVVLRLLAKIYDPTVDLAQLESLIQVDAALSFRLLRLINSAFYNLPRKLSSIQEALVILGLRTTRMWLTLISLAGLDDKPSELFTQAMVRAKVCELLARSQQAESGETFFVVGLFSLLDAMLDRPLEEILNDLPLSAEVTHSLLEGRGTAGEALRCAIAFEQADWPHVAFGSLPEAQLRESYVDAIGWARNVWIEIGR